MFRTRRTYRRDGPEAVASVIAALIAHNGRLDWREHEFFDGVGCTAAFRHRARALHGGAVAPPRANPSVYSTNRYG